MHPRTAFVLGAVAASLVTATPFPQTAAPVPTLAANDTMPSPAVTLSNQTSTATSSPAAGAAELLGQLNKVQGEGGTAEGVAADPETTPSSAFANFADDSPADTHGSASLEGLLQSIKQATTLPSGMSREAGGTATSAEVHAVETTSAGTPVSEATSAVESTPAATPSAVLLAANTTTSAPTIATSASPLLFPLPPPLTRMFTATVFHPDDFFAGASFPSEATAAVAGVV
ncbi:hypothetical protein JCM3770_003710 [Rhodotorula araucariae]